MFSVITPAANKKLTSLTNLKIELGIADADTSQDVLLNRFLDRLSAVVCNYMGVPAASNGAPTFALETLEENLTNSPWLRRRGSSIVLSRRPVTEIVSVTAAGTLIDTSDFELDPVAGILTRTGAVGALGIAYTPGARTLIQYKAGFTLPPTANYTLPFEIEGAVIDMIRLAKSASVRDPTIKSEWTLDIRRLDYWVGQIGEDGAFPPNIASVLDGSPWKYEPAVG